MTTALARGRGRDHAGRQSTFARCSGPNGLNGAVRGQILTSIGENAVGAWNRHPHAPKRGLRPLEVFQPGGAEASAAAARKTVKTATTTSSRTA